MKRALTYSFSISNPLAETFTDENNEKTRVLYCQESIFIIVKNDYSTAVDSTLLSCVQILLNNSKFEKGKRGKTNQLTLIVLVASIKNFP